VLAGEATNAFENRYVCEDGLVKWILWNAVPTPGGELVYASGHDITERKRIEQERERLLEKEQDQVERLRELDRLKDDFVASVSHELRTPLTSIQGYLELVLDKSFGGDLLTDDQRSFLAVVERNSDRLQRLVADLLFVAQVDAGALVLERSEVDVAEVARECVEAARPVAEEKGIELAWVGEPPPPVSGDRARLGQLLDNLVSNALKFTPEGGRVEVKTASANGEAVIEVEDTGVGISPEEQERLFQRFFRAAHATERAIQGTGLGLSITKAIVEAHGGRISVTSAEGGGTTFTVHLPLARKVEELGSPATERAKLRSAVV
jgi:signal transduction histidine kinase